MRDPEPLVLVDGSSYLYRAFHAMPGLTTSAGAPTGAVYGIILMLRRLLAEHKPRRMAVVFDAPGGTFRDRLYSDYKANRPPMPPQLRTQLEAVSEAVTAMGLKRLCVPGVEADDVIGTLATAAAGAGDTVLISSGDKDLAQLVGSQVRMVDGMRRAVYDRDGVIAKFGVPPERIVDYLALVGDASDNVPGVPGVGPKTAAKWLGEHGSLDGVIAHAGDIAGKAGQSLRACLDFLPLARRLLTVRTDLELAEGPADLAVAAPDSEALRALYARLEFKTWLGELADAPRRDAAGRPPEYRLIRTEEELQRWLARLAKAPLVALDVYAEAPDPHQAELQGIAFSDREGRGACLPLDGAARDAARPLTRAAALAALKPLLEDPGKPKVGHDLKRAVLLLARHGIVLGNARFDVMLESYVLDSTGSRHDRDGLALKYLGRKAVAEDTEDAEAAAGAGEEQLSLQRPPPERSPERRAARAAERAELGLRLHGTLWPRLRAAGARRRVFEEIEMPLVPVLARMEANGVGIAPDMLRRQSADLGALIERLEGEAHAAAGASFNVSSPKQLQEVLYGKLQLPVLRKTPGGQPSTAEGVLRELAASGYELPRLVLEHREYSKLKSTYTDKLPQLVHPGSGRIHTTYHQAVAATGRLSSSDPNLQNIPVRTAEGRRIRAAFVPRPGNLLLSADYSQIELRIAAHLSGDAGLLAAFRRGADIHRATAAEVFGVPPERVAADQRRHAKAINFGLIYGMSAFGLARQLGIEQGLARRYMDMYFSRYPGVKAFMDATRAAARDQGYVETVFGRRLHLPEIRASNRARRQYAERTAINAPMQGTAADIIKKAMLAVAAWLDKDGAPVSMIMQVHDELVFEVAEDAAQDAARMVAGLMSGVAELAVPLEVEIGTGADWASSHP